MRSSAWFRASVVLSLLMPVGVASAQNAAEQAINAIRQLSSVGPSDQRQIKNWIDIQANRLDGATNIGRADGFNDKAFRTFRAAMQGQFKNSQNTPAFVTAFAEQTTIVAVERFKKTDASSSVLRGLARSLVDHDRVESVPGLLAGLQVSDESTRYLCVRGLSALRTTIEQDTELFGKITQALAAAGQKEKNGFIVGRIYEAINYPSQLAVVFPIYLQILDARLASRKAGTNADIAETFAFEFFRKTCSRLDNTQKVALAKRLAVILRLDAQRYNDPTLAPPNDHTAPDRSYIERDALERRLDGCETVLEIIVGNGKGGSIRKTLAKTGYAGRADVLQEAQKWYGEGTVAGVLNAAPWNVPTGAP